MDDFGIASNLNLFFSGSVWIGLILLKLKTYCWNHCSKINFKCVNSAVEPIFNEKIDKKWNLWVREQCTDALSRKTGQKLRLLFIYRTWTLAASGGKTREKKKKKKNENAETETQQTPTQTHTDSNLKPT